MKRKPYRPGSLEDVAARHDAERWTLVFVRELRHPPQQVWSALTDPAQLRAWAPFDVNRDLGATGPVLLTMAGAAGSPPPSAAMEGRVHRAEPPRLLEYDWAGDRLRWELEALDAGRATRLTLHHTVQDQSWLAKVAAGWHICLDVAERNLSGDPIGRIVAQDAMDYDWQRLCDGYADKLKGRR